MIYRFGNFSLDPDRLELRSGEELVTVEPQVLALLTYLVQNREKVVSKDEIFENIWQGRIVSDGTLNSRINFVRRAVGDSGSDQAVIKTFPRRGFRFVADVDEGDGVTEPSSLAVSMHGVADAIFRRPAIAVLPFENLSGDPDQDYFSDGLTADIISALSLWKSFPVIARNSTFAYKGKSIDIRKVGEELGARYVVEGSVRKGGQRVRVTAQLIDTEFGHHIWAERFDRDLVDVFDLQDELTQRIAATVSPELERAEHHRVTTQRPGNLDAWDFYLRGMSLLHEFNPASNVEALKCFHEALELDSTYGRAHWGQAWVHVRDIVLGSTESVKDSAKQAFDAARRAVEMDPMDSDAHNILAVTSWFVGEHDLSIAEDQAAIELNPSNALGYGGLGMHLTLAGQPEQGIRNLETALKLNPHDPRNHIYAGFMARAQLTAGHYEAACEWARRVIQLRPQIPENHLVLVSALGHLDLKDEARAALERCEKQHPRYAANPTTLHPYRHATDTEHFFDGLRKAGWEG